MRCRGDAAVSPEENPGSFGTSSGQLSKGETGEKQKTCQEWRTEYYALYSLILYELTGYGEDYEKDDICYVAAAGSLGRAICPGEW
jgi:hypothetical protein